MKNVCPSNDLKASFLVGPTATGKTVVAQWIAENYFFDILSADAMMVYRDMDIGTAKPDKTFRKKVHYWGLDMVAPQDYFSAGMYRAHALAAIRQAVSCGRRVIVTGGTGLYLKSLTHGLARLPEKNAAVRRKADELMKREGIGALQKWARTEAALLYENLADKTNPRRLVRIIETARCPGVGEGQSWRRIGKGPRVAGLLMPMQQIYDRIKLRVVAMYSGGLLNEVKRLLQEQFEAAPTAAKAIGYAEAIGFLRGKCSLPEAMEETTRRTRQLAKRQMTWFRHQTNVEWIMIDSAMTTEQVARLVMECWEKIGPTPIIE